ncbi:Hypothetical protein TR210_172 [Trichococcus ilyis]|uniref:Uncharacterized protein n=1 Tax=Trichococcus ilyis TaxID=640938 RepID=A0A143YA27_9LACT|nr:Hypothetical protein TR210_172 [Trichococcus ilyis]
MLTNQKDKRVTFQLKSAILRENTTVLKENQYAKLQNCDRFHDGIVRRRN